MISVRTRMWMRPSRNDGLECVDVVGECLQERDLGFTVDRLGEQAGLVGEVCLGFLELVIGVEVVLVDCALERHVDQIRDVGLRDARDEIRLVEDQRVGWCVSVHDEGKREFNLDDRVTGDRVRGTGGYGSCGWDAAFRAWLGLEGGCGVGCVGVVVVAVQGRGVNDVGRSADRIFTVISLRAGRRSLWLYIRVSSVVWGACVMGSPLGVGRSGGVDEGWSSKPGDRSVVLLGECPLQLCSTVLGGGT